MLQSGRIWHKCLGYLLKKLYKSVSICPYVLLGYQFNIIAVLVNELNITRTLEEFSKVVNCFNNLR